MWEIHGCALEGELVRPRRVHSGGAFQGRPARQPNGVHIVGSRWGRHRLPESSLSRCAPWSSSPDARPRLAPLAVPGGGASRPGSRASQPRTGSPATATDARRRAPGPSALHALEPQMSTDSAVPQCPSSFGIDPPTKPARFIEGSALHGSDTRVDNQREFWQYRHGGRPREHTIGLAR